VQPQGFDHGGHNEVEQGEIDARLVETIHDERGAGAILFAWLDEWFKRNWLVMDFEIPADRNPKWLNALDPEQNYGLLAARPGRAGAPIVLDGRGEEWPKDSLLASAPAEGAEGRPRLRALRATSDEGWLYLRLDVDRLDAGGDGLPDWDRLQLLVGIDTYGASEGDTRFPEGLKLTAPTGMEFMVEIGGKDPARILVDTPYDLFSHRFNRPYRSVSNDDGAYVPIAVETNRRRVGRDGTIYPAVRHDLSPLRRGTTDPASAAYDDLADWEAGGREGILEIRLPWGLLNVTDPSSRRVVADRPDRLDEIGTTVTDGFRFYVAVRDPRDGTLLGSLPPHDLSGRITAQPSTLYTWRAWEEPTYHLRPKKSYAIVRDRWGAIPDVVSR
jgi:hypothetical protein